MSRIATAENAADYGVAAVAVVPYDFRLDAHIGHLDLRVIAEVILSSRRMI